LFCTVHKCGVGALGLILEIYCSLVASGNIYSDLSTKKWNMFSWRVESQMPILFPKCLYLDADICKHIRSKYCFHKNHVYMTDTVVLILKTVRIIGQVCLSATSQHKFDLVSSPLDILPRSQRQNSLPWNDLNSQPVCICVFVCLCEMKKERKIMILLTHDKT